MGSRTRATSKKRSLAVNMEPFYRHLFNLVFLLYYCVRTIPSRIDIPYTYSIYSEKPETVLGVDALGLRVGRVRGRSKPSLLPFFNEALTGTSFHYIQVQEPPWTSKDSQIQCKLGKEGRKILLLGMVLMAIGCQMHMVSIHMSPRTAWFRSFLSPELELAWICGPEYVLVWVYDERGNHMHIPHYYLSIMLSITGTSRTDDHWPRMAAWTVHAAVAF